MGKTSLFRSLRVIIWRCPEGNAIPADNSEKRRNDNGKRQAQNEQQAVHDNIDPHNRGFVRDNADGQYTHELLPSRDGLLVRQRRHRYYESRRFRIVECGLLRCRFADARRRYKGRAAAQRRHHVRRHRNAEKRKRSASARSEQGKRKEGQRIRLVFQSSVLRRHRL